VLELALDSNPKYFRPVSKKKDGIDVIIHFSNIFKVVQWGDHVLVAGCSHATIINNKLINNCAAYAFSMTASTYRVFSVNPEYGGIFGKLKQHCLSYMNGGNLYIVQHLTYIGVGTPCKGLVTKLIFGQHTRLPWWLSGGTYLLC